MAEIDGSFLRVRDELRGMPAFLRDSAARFRGDAILSSPAGTLCFLEQVWHLADLESEGFAVRIRRILDEDNPVLADFDGARVARERNYRALSLEGGLVLFTSTRLRNLEILEGLDEVRWARAATQEGVGRLRLSDLPRRMAEHDASHRDEIRALLAEPPGSIRPSQVA